MICLDGIIFSLQRHGGISVYFRELIRSLQASDVPSCLVLEVPVLQDDALGLHRAPLLKNARVFERYRRCRIEPATSVFHSSYYRCPSASRVPTVVTVHDFIYERYAAGPRRWVHMQQKHAAIRAAQAVICVSEATRQDLLRWVGDVPGQQVHVIHNGVAPVFRPLDATATRSSGPMESVDSRPFVLYVGERRGYKNFTRLLEALPMLPDIELRCVGGGALGAEEMGTLPESCRARVRHLGFISDEVLNQQYNQGLCLVYPSDYEGFGIPVLEAMRAGCPVVSSRCAAVLEVGGSALTVADSLDPDVLCKAILRTTEPSYRAEKIARGIERANSFSWNRTHAQTLDAYRRLGANASAALP